MNKSSIGTNGTEHADAQLPKRKYSRNGCAACKKRRMKCDETKPKCWQCERLNRECQYISNPKNKKRRPRVAGIEGSNSNPQMHSSSMIQASISQSPTGSELSLNADHNFSFSDAHLLFNGLSDLVNFRLEEALTPGVKPSIEAEDEIFTAKLDDSQYLSNTTDMNGIIFNNPISNFNLGDPHNRYMQRFYDEFCDLACPFVPNVGSNPLRDILLHYAKREPYLMYAILACGAQSLHYVTRLIQDDQAYCSYLCSCLSILSGYFEDEGSLSGNVEAMLLTTLLLTSHCASSKNLKWRAHLNGAKELLKKTKMQSDTLNFCKNWLITYEVLAGITNPYGGILQADENELSNFITNDESYIISLKRLNMLDINGFNYISGHMIQLDLVFRDIINILNKIRRGKQDNLIGKNQSHLDPSIQPNVVSFDEVNNLFYRLSEYEKLFVIDRSGIITESNLNHPSHNSLVNNFKNIDTIHLSNGESITYSWFDIAHQAHIIVARITILTKILELSVNNILVQDLVKKGLSFLSFLNSIDINKYTNNCPTHLHLMIDIIGRCCIDEEDQKLARKFLEFLKSTGLASADYNLEKLQKIWNNAISSDEEEDILTW